MRYATNIVLNCEHIIFHWRGAVMATQPSATWSIAILILTYCLYLHIISFVRGQTRWLHCKSISISHLSELNLSSWIHDFTHLGNSFLFFSHFFKKTTNGGPPHFDWKKPCSFSIRLLLFFLQAQTILCHENGESVGRVAKIQTRTQ